MERNQDISLALGALKKAEKEVKKVNIEISIIDQKGLTKYKNKEKMKLLKGI